MKTKLREMRPEDIPVLEEKLREQNERDKTSYGLPVVFDAHGQRMPNIVLALAAVSLETGEVVQGHIYERTVEHTCYGIDAEATVCSMHEQDAVFWMLRQRGYEDFHILVPPERVSDMEHGLQRILGMIKSRNIDFYRRLDAEENAALQRFYAKRRERESKEQPMEVEA